MLRIFQSADAVDGDLDHVARQQREIIRRHDAGSVKRKAPALNAQFAKQVSGEFLLRSSHPAVEVSPLKTDSAAARNDHLNSALMLQTITQADYRP
jgi:hypothetical protein